MKLNKLTKMKNWWVIRMINIEWHEKIITALLGATDDLSLFLLPVYVIMEQTKNYETSLEKKP